MIQYNIMTIYPLEQLVANDLRALSERYDFSILKETRVTL